MEDEYTTCLFLKGQLSFESYVCVCLIYQQLITTIVGMLKDCVCGFSKDSDPAPAVYLNLFLMPQCSCLL